MKRSLLYILIIPCIVLGQLDDSQSTSNGAMTLGTGTGVLYQFAGDQRGSDTTNQSQGGFGLLSGSNQISPIVWMYGYGGRNAFQVRKKGYGGTVQNGITLFHAGVNGNVGIGTSNPLGRLHVSTGTSGDAILRIEADTDNNNESDNSEINFIQDGGVVKAFIGLEGNVNAKSTHTLANALILGFEEDRPVQIITDDKVQVTIKSTGIGIGTTSPDAELAVKGDIHAEEVKVDLSVPGPDYVFKEDYNLRTLEETQNYIKEHGHLPNIPSAKEMEENGVELGVMNMKLLEKIEELTLYSIQTQDLLKQQNVLILKMQNEIYLLKNKKQ